MRRTKIKNRNTTGVRKPAHGILQSGKVKADPRSFEPLESAPAAMVVADSHFLRTILDLLPYEIFIKDLQCRYRVNNRMHAHLLGVANPAEAFGKTAFDYYPPDVAAEYNKDDLRIMQSGEAMLDQERRSKGAVGEQRWRQVSKVPLRDPNGKVIGLAGISRDITERKRVQEETQRHTRELAALYEISRALTRLNTPPEILELIYDAAGKILDNRNFYIALYDEPQRQLSFPVYTIGGERIERESRRLANGLSEYVIRTRAPLLITHDLAETRQRLGMDALGKPARCYLGVPMLAGEKVLGVIAVQDYEKEDGYDAKHAEVLSTFAAQAAVALENARLFEEIQRHARELEQANRALEENQEKLLISEKMASLGRLTAGIAHEMNTPLAAVRTSLVELERLAGEYLASIGEPQVTPEDHREIAQEMRKSIGLASNASARAADFVRGIKSQTRDLTQQEHRRFNAVTVVREALLLLHHALRKGNCAATFEPASEVIELYGSPGRLAQVITNLVTNSVDASKVNGGPITLTLTPDTNGIRLQVSDSGCGILPEILPKIFEPMFTTKPFGEGTGLGLAIVHDIVVGEFGGAISVESQPGHGATFVLRFPIRNELSTRR